MLTDRSPKERLSAVFSNVFGIEGVDDSASNETIGEWDSGTHIALILELENEFGMSLTTEEAVAMTSVRAISEVLRNKGIPV